MELAAATNRNRTGSSGDSELDTVTLRSTPGLLGRATMMLPTMKNVQALSAALNSDLKEAFQKAGIPAQPPVEISVDYYNGNRIVVSSDRPDAAQIEKALNSDPKLAEQIHTTLALSSHAAGMQESLAFQSEYRDSNNASAVVAKYSHLFGAQQSHDMSLHFDGRGMTVLMDGKRAFGAQIQKWHKYT